MSFLNDSPRPPPAESPSIEKKKIGMTVFEYLIFSKALKMPRVFEKSISAPLVSPNPGVSQNKYSVPLFFKITVEQNEVSDLENGLFLNLLSSFYLNFFTPICGSPFVSIFSKSSSPRY
jgi:hypothetical protein